jgi:hypothetical protein
MSSLFTRMFRRPMSIGEAAATLVDTRRDISEITHAVAQLQAENARLRAALARHGADAPGPLLKMREHGWLFTYSPATRYIGAQHAHGGRESVAEMRLTGPDFHARDEFGAYLAAALNGR